jgi:tRNA A-37 threonylcarbamoyl transferase component Bud32
MEPQLGHFVDQFPIKLSGDDGQIRKIVAAFFAPARSSEVDQCLIDAYEHRIYLGAYCCDERQSTERGVLGLTLFFHWAERWGAFGQDDDRARADVLLGDCHIRRVLYDLYEIDERFRDSNLALHTTGTTSFIIKSDYFHGKFHHVIKIIKPWFIADAAISEQTAGTKRFYDDRLSLASFRNHRVAPQIDDSNRQSIVMEFVDGITLRQYFADLWVSEGTAVPRSTGESYDALGRVIVSLCGMLKSCDELSIAHGDLSTTNILVEDASTEFPKLRLIDFGINYLLTRNLGRMDDYPSLVSTIDPDVMDKKYEARPALVSDVYSLGIILTEGFLGNDYRVEGVQVVLDRVYERHQGLGAILDDLLDPVPERRLADILVGVEPYDSIASRLDAELRLVSLFSLVDTKLSFRYLEDLAGMVFPGFKDIVKYVIVKLKGGSARRSVLSEPVRRQELVSPVFERADLLIPFCLNIATITVVAGRLIPLDSALQGDRVGASVKEHWSAWIVAASSSIVAARYFISLFAGLPAKGLPRLCVWLARLCAIGPWVPIMLVLYRDPNDWPMYAAIGGSLLVANNVAWYWFTGRAIQAIKTSRVHVSPLMEDTRFSLRGWQETSSITLFCIAAIAVLVAKDILVDVTFYAVLLAIVVNGRIYFANLLSDAPRMRTGIQRLSYGFRRAQSAAETP